MKLLAMALAGALISGTALAQDSVVAGSTLLTSAVTVVAPIALLATITVAAEDNETPTATTPSTSTSTAR